MEWKWAKWWREYKEEWRQRTKTMLFYHVLVVSIVGQVVFGTDALKVIREVLQIVGMLG